MNITEHAIERMAERGFTPDMLGKFLSSGYKVEVAIDGVPFAFVVPEHQFHGSVPVGDPVPAR